jgi:hypothetical protein
MYEAAQEAQPHAKRISRLLAQKLDETPRAIEHYQKAVAPAWSSNCELTSCINTVARDSGDISVLQEA